MDWQELTQLTQGQPVVIERVRLTEKNIVIDGSFDLPQLARLSQEDQVFVAAFVRSHGSIKEMEQTFGVSYPTIKSRLNRIAKSLQFVEIDPAGDLVSAAGQSWLPDRGSPYSTDARQSFRTALVIARN